MPELPEVETTRRGLAPHLEGAVVTRVVIRQAALRWPVSADIAERVPGARLCRLQRRGKYLLFEFETGTALWHLGMSGSLRIVAADLPAAKHDHIDWEFASGAVLRFNDPRRFGALLWSVNPAHDHKLLRHLGPEPLTSHFTGEYLYLRSRRRSQPVKSWLMDSKVVVGVGNIYANEALFMAGIHPCTPAGRLSRQKCDRLVSCVQEVLSNAIRSGGTTLRDFVGGDGKPGYFARSLNVYGRGGEACLRCSKPLTETRLGQRTTVYCVKCQR